MYSTELLNLLLLILGEDDGLSVAARFRGLGSDKTEH